ncbi:hypothetical protein Tco_1352590 [Tanacetum coccineum]
MSSPNHSTSDIEDAFSSMNILNYTSVSSDYFPASSGSSSFNSSENSKDNMIPPVFSSFYNNPCLKDVQAFYANILSIFNHHILITSPAILTLSPVLPPSLLFDPRYFFVLEELLPPKKRICSTSSSSTTMRDKIEIYFEYVDETLTPPHRENGGRTYVIRISYKDSDNLKIELEKVRSQIIKLQKKQLGQKDKITFAHYRISNLEQIIEEIQACHQTDQEDL